MTVRTNAVLAVALLSATTVVRVPTELVRSSAQDLSGVPRDVLLAILAAGILAFAVPALLVACLPRRTMGAASALLVGLAGYAWIRSAFFPGPSLSLDGSRLTADLATGASGLAVPLLGAATLALIGGRQPRALGALLSVLLAGSLLQSSAAAVSAWPAGTRATGLAGAAPLFEWSRRGNVLILVLDSLQSDVFEDVLEARPRLRQELDGFIYYRSATSPSPTTYLSLPTIHGGSLYDPGRTLREFYREAVFEGSVLNRLAAAGYRTSYALGIAPCPRAVTSCVATTELTHSRRELALTDAAHVIDLGVYRALPDALRGTVLARGLLTRIVGEPYLVDRAFGEAAALERLASEATVVDGPPTAKMIHTMITHRPAALSADCSMGPPRDDREGMTLQVTCAFERVTALFDRLKAGGVYDASIMVIVADHGYGFESRFVERSRDSRFRRLVGAFNPAVLVKPAEAHGSLVASDAPIQLSDLAGALCEGAGCSPGDGLLRLEEVDPGRPRRAYWYDWKHQYWTLPNIPGLVRYEVRGRLPEVESWEREAEAYAPGTAIDFRRGGGSGPFQGFGWGRREATHTWMADAEATIWLKAAFDGPSDYLLVLNARLAGGASARPARVKVEVNGVEVGELRSITLDGGFETFRLPIPAAVLSRSSQTTIRFSVRDPESRSGDVPETRLGVQTVEIRPPR